MNNEEPQSGSLATTLAEHVCKQCAYNLDGVDVSGACPECGFPIIDGCIRCDYNLVATDPSGQCPECGVPVSCSIGSSALGGVSTEQLKSVHLGFKLVTSLILLYIVVILVMTGVVLSTAVNLNAGEDLYLAGVAAAVLSHGLVLGVIYGWFKLTQPLVGLPRMLNEPGTRSFVRVMLWIFVGVTLLNFMYSLVPADTEFTGGYSTMELVYLGFAVLSIGIMLVLFISNVLYVGWVARLVRNEKMYKRSKHLVWSGPLLVIVGAAIFVLGPLIALVLYWNMLEYVRRDLKKIIKARAAGA